MSRYGSENDETAVARQRHAAQEQREHEEDRRATDRMWREGESRRAQARWESQKSQAMNWDFRPIVEEGGRVSGWNVFLNTRKVGVIVSVRNDLVVITSDDEGGATAHYVRGSERASPNANEIMAAFQRQLPSGAR